LLLASSFKKTIDAGTSMMHTRGYSRAIHVDGAYSTIYLAGVTSIRDLYTNRSLLGDFDGQVRDIFARINQTLVEQFCGELHDLVTMTVFITNGSLGTRFTEIRREIFNERDFPTSALITLVSLANEVMMVEVQSVAVMASTNEEQSIRSNGFVIFICCSYILQRFF
jgi:2-iminobutanoate/2-iminopropanoate deaminase